MGYVCAAFPVPWKKNDNINNFQNCYCLKTVEIKYRQSNLI